jgi:hypothetical protein
VAVMEVEADTVRVALLEGDTLGDTLPVGDTLGDTLRGGIMGWRGKRLESLRRRHLKGIRGWGKPEGVQAEDVQCLSGTRRARRGSRTRRQKYISRGAKG